MALDTTTIESFVRNRYSTPQVQKLVANWRLEPEVVAKVLIEHFHEMGIFFVPYGHERLMMRHLLSVLRHSPELAAAVKKNEVDLLRRMRTRHSG